MNEIERRLDAGRIEGRSVTDKLIRHSFLRFNGMD